VYYLSSVRKSAWWKIDKKERVFVGVWSAFDLFLVCLASK
jgi:hypothetical protein